MFLFSQKNIHICFGTAQPIMELLQGILSAGLKLPKREADHSTT
jgi:hypothetical protein